MIYNLFSYLNHLIGIFSLKDGLDIIIVAILIYVVILFLKQTRSYLVFYTVLLFLVGTYIAGRLDLTLTRQLLQPLLTFFILIFAIIFQKDIRRFFEWFFISGRRLAQQKKLSMSNEVANIIVRAVEEMAKKKMGAIIVFPGDYPLESVVDGGFSLDGKVTRPLLLSIFDTTSPGHDGAVIIENNRVRRFGVHLPLADAEKYQGFGKAGTRHRAAAGVTEKTDAIAIVVSEERGEISIAESGVLRVAESSDELEAVVKNFIKENIEVGNSFWDYFLVKNWNAKILSLGLALAAWAILVGQIGMVSQTFSVPVETKFVSKELAVDQISPQNVEVTVTGYDRDLRDFDSKQIKMAIDLSAANAGWMNVLLTKDNLTLPAFITPTKISPEQVKITLKKATKVDSR